MKCPGCGKEMRRGYLNTKGLVIWSENEEKLSIFSFKGEITLIDAFEVNKPPAYLCEDCKTVVTTYK